MLKPGILWGFLACGLLLQAGPLAAHHKKHHSDEGLNPYPVADAINLPLLLAPPPAPGSSASKIEIEQMLKIQAARTDAQTAACIADHVYDVYRFADVLGPKFDPNQLPLTTTFFTRVLDTGKSVVEPAKDYWKRERPALVDSRIRPAMKEAKSWSYPSGHATAGTLMAIVLSAMVPEKSPVIFARGWQFAQNRVIAGEHFPSDIQAGRITGSVIASQLFQNEDFKKDFAAAKIELRTALGYPVDAAH